jgi:hypothetical protein
LSIWNFRLNVYLQLVLVIFGTDYITNNKAIKITIFDLFDASESFSATIRALANFYNADFETIASISCIWLKEVLCKICKHVDLSISMP